MLLLNNLTFGKFENRPQTQTLAASLEFEKGGASVVMAKPIAQKLPTKDDCN